MHSIINFLKIKNTNSHSIASESHHLPIEEK
jgi:hypothetical protein